MHVARTARTPLSTLTAAKGTSISDIIAVLVIADIIVKVNILTSISLDLVSETCLILASGQKEAHTEHIWIQKETGNGFHLCTDDGSSK